MGVRPIQNACCGPPKLHAALESRLTCTVTPGHGIDAPYNSQEQQAARVEYPGQPVS
jgi:hypothetical protein